MSIERRSVRKESLPKLFQALVNAGKQVYAPVTRNNITSFKVVKEYSELASDYIQTTQSSKEVSFPRTEKVLGYIKNKDGVEVNPFDMKVIRESVVWGIRPCDAMGKGELGAIFNWDTKDEIYNARVDKTTLISFSCSTADEYCFCTSVGGNPGNTEGSDILLTRLGAGGDYLAEIISEKGIVLMNLVPDIFEKDNGAVKDNYLASIPVKFNHEEIRNKLDKFFESEEWLKQSLRCIGCGACAYVCPTCACFDIQDESHGKAGRRVRTWDSCGFSLFTLHTSGHNPREVQSQRWRQRIMHKFSYMPERLSVFGCTGCGRCSRGCPVDMNILEHLISIQEVTV